MIKSLLAMALIVGAIRHAHSVTANAGRETTFVTPLRASSKPSPRTLRTCSMEAKPTVCILF
jgi:hypothetical protein